jgi:hypothetical protein
MLEVEKQNKNQNHIFGFLPKEGEQSNGKISFLRNLTMGIVHQYACFTHKAKQN